MGSHLTLPMITASAWDTETAIRFIKGRMQSSAKIITVIVTMVLNIRSPVLSLIFFSLPYQRLSPEILLLSILAQETRKKFTNDCTNPIPVPILKRAFTTPTL